MAAVDKRAIETHSGVFIDPLEPDPEKIVFDDIAHALSNICRFTGHTSRFYSVAEHSVNVARLLKSWGCGDTTVLSGLMHDAAEAYLCDLPSPIKNDVFGDSYRCYEDHLMEAVARKIGFPHPMDLAVKRADEVMLWCEAYVLLPSMGKSWARYSDHGIFIIENNINAISWIRYVTDRGIFYPWIVGDLFREEFKKLAPL